MLCFWLSFYWLKGLETFNKERMENIMSPEVVEAAHRAKQRSIIKAFTIEGLYGYRTVSLSSKYAATILIAKNGSGKTTLLAVLDAFLKGQFGRLTGLQFERIVCSLDGIPEDLVLTKIDVLSLTQIGEHHYLHQAASSFGISSDVLLDFIDNDYLLLQKGSNSNLVENEVFDKIRTKVGFSMAEARKIVDRLVESLKGRNENVELILRSLNKVLGDTEIVYLPTYRRIELPLEINVEDDRKYGKRRPNVQSRLGFAKRGLLNAEIQFGLRDISDRLADLNQNILYKSGIGYREISANIINELISGEFDRGDVSPGEIPDKEALSLFFSRINDGRRVDYAFGPVAIPAIDKIYSGLDIQQSSNKFLNFFLGKLNTVINSTRDIELQVEEFIGNCNRYLSVQKNENMGRSDEDDKILRLDRRNLRVSVESLALNRKIALDSLSSGEKQMVSLFARIYLYAGKKIVLIDEPEISLSLDWQKRILMDVLRAQNCSQVIAITHSPFVFDNILERYAKPLTVILKKDTQVHGLDDEDDLHE